MNIKWFAVVVGTACLTLRLLSAHGGTQRECIERASLTAEQRTVRVEPTQPVMQPHAKSFGVLPVQFVENRGQFPEPARFVVGAPHAMSWITNAGLVLTTAKSAPRLATPRSEYGVGEETGESGAMSPVLAANVALTFENAASCAFVRALEPTATRFSYFLGNDPARWVKGVVGHSRLRWDDLYPGVSVELSGESGHLEYDVSLAPGADLASFVIRVDGAEGLSLQSDGTLCIDTAGGPIHQAPPPTWELDNRGAERRVACRYRLIDPQRFGFEVEGREPSLPLVIDPELIFGTFIGGSSADEVNCTAVDAFGYIYLGGGTSSGTDFPVTPGAFSTTIGSFKPDGFVAKMSAAGDSIVYATYIGGNDTQDAPSQISVVNDGEVTVAGSTGSTNFPTTQGAFDSVLSGLTDGYIVRLAADGSDLVFSTMIGGSKQDAILGMGVDDEGRACFAGKTWSSDYPVTPNAFVSIMPPIGVAGSLGRLSADGSTLEYSTFVPGASTTKGLALDAVGHAYVTGHAGSGYIKTPGAFHTSSEHVFVYKFDFDGNALVYSSTFGSAGIEIVYGIAVDSSGSAYVTGDTDGSTFPTTPGAFDVTFNGDHDAFIAKLSPDGRALDYGTFFGGSGTDQSFSIAVDAQQRLFIAGRTFSTNLPVTPDAFDPALSGNDGAYFAELSADGSSLLYCTYFGGSTLYEFPLVVAVDELGDAIVAGYTHAPDFPTTPGSFMPDFGTGDANMGFVLKFNCAPWTDLGHGLASRGGIEPHFIGSGDLVAGGVTSLALNHAVANAPAFLVVGLSQVALPLKGGTLIPEPVLIIEFVVPATGGFDLTFPWPSGLPVGTEIVMQAWIADAGGPVGFSATNGLSAVTP